LHEVSDTVETADEILQKEREDRLEAEKKKFAGSVEAFRRIMEE
jgi:hypothetical protein